MKLPTIIILIVVATILILFIGYNRLPDFVSHALSKKMKVSVSIEDISLSLQKIEVEKIDIGNPPNSKLSKAFSCDTLEVDCPLKRFLDQDIVIDEITLNHIYLGLEFDSPGSSKGNWTTIMGNFSSETSSDKEEKTVLIKKLILDDIRGDIAFRKGGKTQAFKPIKHLEFTNVSSKEGIPTDQITKIVFREMLRSVFDKQNLQNMLENVIENPRGDVRELVQPFKGLLNTVPNPALSEEK